MLQSTSNALRQQIMNVEGSLMLDYLRLTSAITDSVTN